MGSSFKLKGGRGKMDPYAALQRQGLISPVRNEPEKLGEVKGEEKDYGMAGYTSVDFTNQLGEGLQVFKPESRTVGGSRKYYYTDKSGNRSEVTKEQYLEKLSNKGGGEKGSFRKTEHGDIIGGGA